MKNVKGLTKTNVGVVVNASLHVNLFKVMVVLHRGFLNLSGREPVNSGMNSGVYTLKGVVCRGGIYTSPRDRGPSV